MIPTDEDFDDMHHALGRPDGPHVEPYRNRFITDANGPQAARFEALGLWDKAGTMNEGRDAIYSVSLEGRALLMKWLGEKNAARGIRAWALSGGGLTPRTIMAKSRSAAKYDVFLSISDATGESFEEFMSRPIRARAA